MMEGVEVFSIKPYPASTRMDIGSQSMYKTFKCGENEGFSPMFQ
ncbi:MAG: hypothetical protein ABL920_08515 [Methylotenera sp.]